MVFIDLEKAFNRLHREVVQWAMRKISVEEWLVRIVMQMHEDSRMAVRVLGALSEYFTFSVGVHQGSVLSALLFIIVQGL